MMGVRGEGGRRETEHWLSYPPRPRKERKLPALCFSTVSLSCSLSESQTHTVQPRLDVPPASCSRCGFILWRVEDGEVKEMEPETHTCGLEYETRSHAFTPPSMSPCITSLNYFFSYPLCSYRCLVHTCSVTVTE